MPSDSATNPFNARDRIARGVGRKLQEHHANGARRGNAAGGRRWWHGDRRVGPFWLSRHAATLLFGIKPVDALTYAAVAVLLPLTAVAACYLPGRRAMWTDPAVALRGE